MTRRKHKCEKAGEGRTSATLAGKAAAARDRRTRQVCVARILEEGFGGLDQCRPSAWSRRAYWMLAGLIYERLAVDQESLTTAEVVALAKALAERERSQRGTSHRNAGGGSKRGSRAADETGRLARFARMIRDIYGVKAPSERRSAFTSEKRGETAT
ncbi:MAG: hypothetical protein F9K17_07760 [Phycisphaerae bacterium]|nr:MAG: hypothetical protein F9K17_07760 [Phycisphaerae bacterium]